MENILLFASAVAAINIALFFLVPNPQALMLSLSSATQSPWTLLTFQFFHANLIHLAENVAGLLVAGFLLRELAADFKTFALVYFVSILIVSLPLALIFPGATVTGNSMGIFGLLGLAVVKSRRIVPSYVSLPAFLFLIFSFTIVNFFSCGQCYQTFIQSDVFHLFGFAAGITVCLLLPLRRKRVLTGLLSK